MVDTVHSTAKVNGPTFFGLLWTGLGLSLSFIIFRLYVRLTAFRKLYSDDFVVIAAWAMFCGSAILWQTQEPTLYEETAVSAKLMLPTPAFLERLAIFLRSIVAFNVLFYSCLWAIKISFLLFFRRLGQRARGHSIWWWIVLSFVIASWAVCIGDIQYRCALKPIMYILQNCAKRDAIRFQQQTFHVNCALDVVTDCLVITIPVLMLWKVRISIRKKLALIGIFSLTVIVMVFAIVRVGVVSTKDRIADISWLYFWSNVEMVISIIVACLGSFRQLYVSQTGSSDLKPSANSSSATRRGLLSSFWSNISSASKTTNRDKWQISHSSREKSISRGSDERIMPLDSIYISRDVDQSSEMVYDNRKTLSRQYTRVAAGR